MRDRWCSRLAFGIDERARCALGERALFVYYTGHVVTYAGFASQHLAAASTLCAMATKRGLMWPGFLLFYSSFALAA